MNYTCLNTVFKVEDLEARKFEVDGSVYTFLRNEKKLTPSRWVFKNRRKWCTLKKASFIYYVTKDPRYKNPVLQNIHNKHY